ncbi:hypothetical protein AKJ09_08904 [Labilithrix luteola]|uniref:STAS domain-containing protein n=1 Tax=Labilithrix luteola TaxID=1391654 RepID=A0A0K1Q8Y7_9BACT|nr:hypothetical protein [Labilithrix luteola]AKV02241.1 hypothetical protein AKJ09_08904 [Labilithrix luteola]
MSHPGNAVMLFTYDGYATADFVPFIEGAVDRVLATGMRPDVFIDLDRIEGYDSEYRQAVSKWGARTYRRLGEVRFLVRSRIVAMGIAVSNLTAGGQLKPTTKRAEFQAALQSAVARQAARA